MDDTRPLRPLPTDMSLLTEGMEDHSETFDYYLDTKTGEVLMLPGIAGDETAYEPSLLEEVERRFEAEPDRYQEVPRIESRRGYRWMEAFAGSVEDAELRDLLEVALDGRGAFGRFKRVLSGYPEERERWFRFHGERLEGELRDWLETLGIEPVPGPPRAPGPMPS